MTDQPSPHVSGTIKALEWDDFEGQGAKATAFGRFNYLITRWSDGRFEVCESYPGYQGARIGDGFYPSLDAAKAAAQADYNARILAHIQPDPQPVDDSEAHAHEHQQGLLSEGADPQPVVTFTDTTGHRHDWGRVPAAPSSAPASVAEARAVIQTKGVEWTASAMIQHIAYVLRAKGKAVLTSDAGNFGRQVLDFDAALRTIAEESK